MKLIKLLFSLQGMFLTFALFCSVIACMWLFIPLKLSAAFSETSGAYALALGRDRGADVIALAIIGFVATRLEATITRRGILLGFFLYNALLMIPGTMAQFNTLVTPTRWPVFALHAGWAIAFGYYLFLEKEKVRD